MKNWFARLRSSSLPNKTRRPRRVRLLLEQLEDRVAPAVITVTSTGDTIAIDGLATLREAITSINNQADVNGDVTLNRVGGYASTPGGTPDVINFDIPAAGVQKISATSAEPTIVMPLTINGYSQVGASANTLVNADNAVILIQLDGTGAGTNVNGLTLGAGSGGSTIKGLDITNFQADAMLNGGVGILVQSNGNTIVGNFIGVNPAGTVQMPNGGDGIRILDASNNMIGSTNPAERNVTSGNMLDGIHVEGTIAAPATGNLIEGNFVGVAADGKSNLIPTGGPSPSSITLGPDGDLWFTETSNNAIGRITPAGVVTEFSLAGLGANRGPVDIVSGPGNLLYFTEASAGRIGRINPLAGSDAAILGSETQSAVVPSGAGTDVSGITVGPDGNLWFTEANASANRVGNITPNLATINEFSAGITAGTAPVSIVSGADGALWFTENAGDRIGRITTGGGVTEFTLPAGNGPYDIVSDPANNLLYFTEKNVGRIGNINPLAGSDAAIQASVTESAVVPSGAGARVNGITLGPDGNLWFAEIGVDRVGNINTTLTTINEFSTGIAAGANPADIVTGPDGALWFTEFASGVNRGRIGRITTAGVVSEFATLPAGAARGNNLSGIEISGGNNNTVGGTIAGARNVVGFNGTGIEVDDGGQSNIIQGNFSGIGADGVTPVKNLLHGIVLRSSNTFNPPLGPAQPNEPGVSFNLIGGAAAGAGNLVEFNGTAGIAVFGNPVSASGQPNIGNAIEGNSVFENARSNPSALVGIDLTNSFVFPKDDGLTPNDSKGHGAPNDPNNFQNFPVLTFALPDNGNTDITGTLKSTPNSTFRIEFFASDPDPLGGIPEGQQFLGFVSAITDASGNASFSTSLNVPVAAGRIVTATATDSIGNTSEFSAGIRAGGTPNQLFVIKAYHDLLGRFPDAGGLSDWTGLLDQGVPPSQVVLDIETDAGHEYYTRLVQNFYQFYLKRAEGPGDGNALAVGFLAAGGPIEQLRTVFTSSQEYFNTRGGGTNSGFVNAVYLDAFNTPNRLATDPGAQTFLQLLNNGTLTRVQGSLFIFNSTEYRDDLVQGFYPLFLNRFGASSELDSWAAVLAAGTPDQQVIAQILGSPESFGKPLVQPAVGTSTINDLYVFRSPSNANNTVLIMNFQAFPGVLAPNFADPSQTYTLHIDNSNPLNATDDIALQVTYGAPDSNGVQDVTLTGISASNAALSGVLATGKTGQNISILSVNGTFRSAIQDDPAFFDSGAFDNLIAAGDKTKFPRSVGQAKNFFGPNVNTFSIVLEVPSAQLTPVANGIIGVWSDISKNGVQLSRMGRPLIDDALIPPVPRTNLTRGDRQAAFEAGLPINDRTNFKADMVSVLTNPSFIFKESAATADAVSNLLLPDVLVFQIGNPNGYGTFIGPVGQYLGNGRRLTDPVVHTTLSVLSGGALTTDNVDDDNGFRITDGSIETVSGKTRSIAFPYIGAADLPLNGPGTLPNP